MSSTQEASASQNEPARRIEAWREQSVGRRKWQHGFFHALLKTMGMRPAYHMMYLVTFWYVLFSRAVRRRTRHYLSRRFPARQGPLPRFLDSFRLLRNFGRTLVDLAAFGMLERPGIRASFPGEEQMLALCEQPRGLVMLNAHAGCWQIAISSISNLKKQANLVMLPDPQAQKFLDRYGVKIIDPRTGLESVVAMMQALRRGEIVCLMGDRAFGDKNTVAVKFMGEDIRVPVSPYRLASAAGVPVVVLAAPRTAIKSYEMRLARIIEVPRGLGQDAQKYRPAAQEFADCLEEFVREYPWQFYNFFNMWDEQASIAADAGQ